MQHHLASSKRAGLKPEDWRALKDPPAALFSTAEKAALAYAEKLTRAPGEVSDADVQTLKLHFTDEQVVDLHLLAGLANFTNRFTAPLGLDLEFPPEAIE